jgi:hypothetical protein
VRTILRLAAAAIALAVIVPCLGKAPAAATSRPLRAPVMGIYSPLMPGNAGYTARMDGLLHPCLDMLYVRFGQRPPVKAIRQDHEHGAMAVVTLDPEIALTVPGLDHPSPRQLLGFSLRLIIGGHLDGYLRGYAQALARLRFPVGLSFGHEMNGWWYPWGAPQPGNPDNDGATSPRLFVRAWRHIHDVFTAAGARNLTWIWTVNRVNAATDARWTRRITRRDWPGAAYVNWVGIDAYYPRPDDGFRGRFVPTIRFLRKLAHKPILIAETAVAPNPHELGQIRSLLVGVRRYRLLGFIYFNWPEQENWLLTPPELRYLGHQLRLEQFEGAAAKLTDGHVDGVKK